MIEGGSCAEHTSKVDQVKQFKQVPELKKTQRGTRSLTKKVNILRREVEPGYFGEKLKAQKKEDASPDAEPQC